MKRSLIIIVLIAALISGYFYFRTDQTLTGPQLLPEEIPTDTIVSAVPPPAIDTSTAITVPLVDGYYQIDWNFLAKIDFDERFNEDLQDYIFYPVWHPDVEKLNGKPVQISGYVIPFEETGQEELLILSAYPYSNCFFCGNAGPESVMDIQLQRPLKKQMKQDQTESFRGTLKLNDTDLYYLNYMLVNAELAD